MDAQNLIDFIHSKKVLTDSVKLDVDKLCQDFPYFASAHFLRYKLNAQPTSTEDSFMALLKQDEWLFLDFLAQTRNYRNENIKGQNNNLNHSEASKVNEQEANEDILSLINELPNTNPLTETKEVKEVKPLSKEPELVGQKESEPAQALMVMMSFTEWLNYFKVKKEKEEEEARGQKALKTSWQKEKLAAAVEEDVDEIPEPIFRQAMDSISSESGIISESLAKILASQGKVDKAIDMYKKLSLRNPEKRSYFASLIENLNSTKD